MTLLEITLWSIPASIPGLLIWRWRVRRAQARIAAEAMEYRRQKFGGVIRTPGQREAQRIERP